MANNTIDPKDSLIISKSWLEEQISSLKRISRTDIGKGRYVSFLRVLERSTPLSPILEKAVKAGWIIGVYLSDSDDGEKAKKDFLTSKIEINGK